MIYGGHKSNFFGHSKRSYANIMAFPLVYQPLCLRIYAGIPLASPGGIYAEGCVWRVHACERVGVGVPCMLP